MKVYRFMSEEELKIILNGEAEKLGKYWCNAAGNNHRYKKGKKYIHFFAKEQSVEYIIQTRKMANEFPANAYVCEFDIPITHLLFHYGEGRYLELKGFEYAYVGEFAIRADKFDCKWLTKFKKFQTNKNDEKIKE